MLRIDKDIQVSRSEFDWKEKYFPEPGMLGTQYVGSDRYVIVCISVDSPKRITAKRVYSIDENNVKDNPNIRVDAKGVMWAKDLSKLELSKEEKWSLRTNKFGNQSWHEMGSSRKSSSIHWGIADPYRDPDF